MKTTTDMSGVGKSITTANVDARIAIAERMLRERGVEHDDPAEGSIRTQCPGWELHSTGGRQRDARVFLDQVPTLHCFHASCGGVVDDFNRELRSVIGRAEHSGDGRAATRLPRRLPAVPQRKKEKPAGPRDFDPTPANRLAAQWTGPPPDAEWLRRRSPIDPRGLSAGKFLDALFEPGDRVMVLTYYRSTGDFMWVCGGDEGGRCFRLAKEPGVQAVPAERLPRAGRGGVHFLINPVSGAWKPRRVPSANGNRFGRKLVACLTRWRYLLLESDVLGFDVWMRVVCQLGLRVAAIIRTGGKSAHVIVRAPVDAPSEPEWRLWRDPLHVPLCRLGADPVAMMPTNSSRLPGCIRIPDGHEGSLAGLPVQELLYLDPAPEGTPINLKPEVRTS